MITDGFARFFAILLALCVCIAHPGLPALALFLVVFALVCFVQPGAEDPGKRRREKDRS
jgi:hypothetical protein